MNRVLLFTLAGVAASTVAATPAVVGLSGNSSFSHRLPVRLPAGAHVVSLQPPSATPAVPTTPASPSAVPSVRETQDLEPGDATHTAAGRTSVRPRETEPGDDHGGDRATRTPSPSTRPTPHDTGSATTSPVVTGTPTSRSREPEPSDDHGGSGKGTSHG